MITVKIENYDALQMLCDRLTHWTNDQQTKDLFSKMYENYIDGGVFDGCEFDPMIIVDNDYINYCKVIDESDDDFEKILNLYKNQGIGDISCENDVYSCIEAVDDDDDPTLILVRY